MAKYMKRRPGYRYENGRWLELTRLRPIDLDIKPSRKLRKAYKGTRVYLHGQSAAKPLKHVTIYSRKNLVLYRHLPDWELPF